MTNDTAATITSNSSARASRNAVSYAVVVRLQVSVDAALVYALAERQGRPAEKVIAEITADLECRASDAVRWRDGVNAVGVTSALGQHGS